MHKTPKLGRALPKDLSEQDVEALIKHQISVQHWVYVIEPCLKFFMLVVYVYQNF
jgi:site-specific recombinase XerD